MQGHRSITRSSQSAGRWSRPSGGTILLALAAAIVLGGCAPRLAEVRPIQYEAPRDQVFEVAMAEMVRAGFDVVIEERAFGMLRGRLLRSGLLRSHWDVTASIVTSRTSTAGVITSISVVSDTNDVAGVVPEQDALVRAIVATLDRSFQRSP